MTPLLLQDMLCEEIAELLKDKKFKTPLGEEIPINIFPQHIPIDETDDETDPVPYIIVRLLSGDDDGSGSSFNSVDVVLIAGIYDNAQDVQGHRDLMNIFQKIYERFHKDPYLQHKALYAGEFHWATQEDNYYPYYFGACQMKFYVGAIRREDEYS